jgi:hypothetical protein
MYVNQANSQRFVFGAALAGLWLSGLFLVLDLDTLIAKAIILLILAPISIQLDKLATNLLRPRALAPVSLRQKSIRAFMLAASNRAKARSLYEQSIDKRMAA